MVVVILVVVDSFVRLVIWSSEKVCVVPSDVTTVEGKKVLKGGA